MKIKRLLALCVLAILVPCVLLILALSAYMAKEESNALYAQANELREQGKFAAAEPLYKRGLAIREKALGPDHLHVAVVLQNMADLYDQTGDKAQADELKARAAKIRARPH